MNTADGDWYFTRSNDANINSNDDDNDESSSSDTSEADDIITTIQDPDPDIPDTYNEENVALTIGEQSYRHFRGIADPEKLNPLFEATARAAAQMPHLQRMTLRTEVKASVLYYFSMKYFAPGE